MAHLIPSLARINSLPTPLTSGERALMEALQVVLDDDWVIYVQPFLNGLQPDIIIFSESAGMGIFEVKDWDLSHYRPRPQGKWDVYDSKQGGWQESKVRSPLEQAEHYKDSLIKYELPELSAETALDNDAYALVAPFVYFHGHTTEEAKARVGPAASQHTTVFGHDELHPEAMRRLLHSQHLNKGSKFRDLMQYCGLQSRLRNALDFPEHGRLEVSDILFDLSPDQKRLLTNAPGKKRVIGAAGSGKTLMLARKAVKAALSGQKVLVLCFNITMVNYLNDVIRRLARYERAENRLIIVRHFHRVIKYPMRKNGETDASFEQRTNGLLSRPLEEVLNDLECEDMLPFDVILIDEGQDFSRNWIELTYRLGHADNESHVMFVEDDRQNIYGVDTANRRAVPGILGRPNEMKRSFRINQEVAALANRLVSWSKREFDSGDVELAPASPGGLLKFPRPIWFQGSDEQMLAALSDQVRTEVNQNRSGAFADMVVLVCTVEDGWSVTDSLRAQSLPFITNFERREEYQQLATLYTGDELKMKRETLRRGRKIAFWMQTGRIKVCTIHSFKGWELKRVLVYFNPNDRQRQDDVPLLYTAITRTQDSLVVFNASPDLAEFGLLAAAEGLIDWREPVPVDHLTARPTATVNAAPVPDERLWFDDYVPFDDDMLFVGDPSVDDDIPF